MGNASGRAEVVAVADGVGVYDRVRYVEEIFFATSTSRSVTLPPRS